MTPIADSAANPSGNAARAGSGAPVGADPAPIAELVSSALLLPTVLVAYRLGLFPLLAERPRSLEEIAASLRIQPRAVEAIVAMGASASLLARRADGSVELRPLAREYFLPESPSFFGPYLDLLIDGGGLFTFESVRRAVVDGAPPPPEVSGCRYSARPRDERARQLTLAMHARSMGLARRWPAMVDLSRNECLLDLGGGSGAHSIGACLAWPHLRAVVLDRPVVCELAERFIAEAGLQSRVRTHAADLFDEAPWPDADVHFCSAVFHGISPETCLRLARRSLEHLPPGGRLLVHEILYDDDFTGPRAAAAAAVNMLLRSSEGRQYSGRALAAILRDAGFVDPQVRPAAGGFSIVEGRKAP